jgi:hypothetical protein
MKDVENDLQEVKEKANNRKEWYVVKNANVLIEQ